VWVRYRDRVVVGFTATCAIIAEEQIVLNAQMSHKTKGIAFSHIKITVQVKQICSLTDQIFCDVKSIFTKIICIDNN
jgi:hypothetical protein